MSIVVTNACCVRLNRRKHTQGPMFSCNPYVVRLVEQAYILDPARYRIS